jgi:3-hydroxyacyl-[acyl-carrier-protein] dehydratase
MSPWGPIDDLIAHRPPFRFVDEVVEVGEEDGTMLLRLAHDDPRLQRGALPAVLLLEAMAQATAAFSGARGAATGEHESGVLVSIDRGRLHGCPRGGDAVLLRVKRAHQLGPVVRFSARAELERTLLAEAEITVRRGLDDLTARAGAAAESERG